VYNESVIFIRKNRKILMPVTSTVVGHSNEKTSCEFYLNEFANDFRDGLAVIGGVVNCIYSD
jgi:hypothetical protein